jgi:hypothetical protein
LALIFTDAFAISDSKKFSVVTVTCHCSLQLQRVTNDP